jgi:hypothetical protein
MLPLDKEMLKKYFLSFFRHWGWFVVTTLGSGVMVFLEGAYMIPHFVYWIVAFSGFLVAGYLTWCDEFSRAERMRFKTHMMAMRKELFDAESPSKFYDENIIQLARYIDEVKNCIKSKEKRVTFEKLWSEFRSLKNGNDEWSKFQFAVKARCSEPASVRVNVTDAQFNLIKKYLDQLEELTD